MTKWVKCSNRLPEEGEKVLAYCNDFEIKLDYLIYAPQPIWSSTLMREENYVTHWMPLPEAPND